MMSFCRQVVNKVYSDFLTRRDHHAVIQELSTRQNKYIIIFGSPIHGNLGDQAISCAEREFIEKYYPGYGVVEISSLSYRYSPSDYQKVIHTDDVLLITGGGFLGDLWENEDEFVKSVIRTFPDNSIIVMPQSVFFKENKKLIETKNFLSEYPNLFLFAREANSFQIFCNLYEKDRVFLVPDMVLSLDRKACHQSLRNGVVLCFRRDKEKTMLSSLEELICNRLISKSMKYRYIDTVDPKIISFKARDKHLKNKLNAFSKAQLVITDRLHGMIFAVITHTPCIAIDNLSRKVSGVYEWIKAFQYIKVISSNSTITSSDIDEAIMICNVATTDDASLQLQEAFYPLKEVIGACLEKR